MTSDVRPAADAEEIQRPPSIRTSMWDEISLADRPEVVERVAFLVMTGAGPSREVREVDGEVVEERLTASEMSLHVALASMYEEEDVFRDDDLSLDWTFVRKVVSSLPLPWRRRDGRFTRRVIRIAILAEHTAQAMAGSERHHRQDLRAEGLSDVSVSLVEAACAERAGTILLLRRQKAVAELDEVVSDGRDPDDPDSGY